MLLWYIPMRSGLLVSHIHSPHCCYSQHCASFPWLATKTFDTFLCFFSNIIIFRSKMSLINLFWLEKKVSKMCTFQNKFSPWQFIGTLKSYKFQIISITKFLFLKKSFCMQLWYDKMVLQKTYFLNYSQHSLWLNIEKSWQDKNS